MSIKGVAQEHRTLQSIPTMDEYKKECFRLSTDLRGLVLLRIAAETGITRIEIATLLKSNLNRERRELFVHRSKAVKKRKGGKIVYIERNRYVPINASLMPLLVAYIDSHDSPNIFMQKHHFSKIRHLTPEAINKMFLDLGIPWSPHKFRHFFKSQVKFWMIQNKQVDMEVIKEIMGHSLSVSEKYGDNPLEYKLSIVDGVFA